MEGMSQGEFQEGRCKMTEGSLWRNYKEEKTTTSGSRREEMLLVGNKMHFTIPLG